MVAKVPVTVLWAGRVPSCTSAVGVLARFPAWIICATNPARFPTPMYTTVVSARAAASTSTGWPDGRSPFGLATAPTLAARPVMNTTVEP